MNLCKVSDTSNVTYRLKSISGLEKMVHWPKNVSKFFYLELIKTKNQTKLTKLLCTENRKELFSEVSFKISVQC